MSGSAPRGRRKARTPSAGLLTAWKRCQCMPDVPGLDAIRGKNRGQLRAVARLIDALCDGRPGTKFFLGSVALGTLLGTHQRTAHRWLLQLEKQGVMRRVWVGKPCRNDETGQPLAGGRLVDRATEYVYAGMPRTRSDGAEVSTSLLTEQNRRPLERKKDRREIRPREDGG